MNRGVNESCCGFLSALANPIRLAMMETRVDGELSVSGLASAIGQGHSVVNPTSRCLSGRPLVLRYEGEAEARDP